jgi:D-sedoheptulose 7-phosphate isomerase
MRIGEIVKENHAELRRVIDAAEGTLDQVTHCAQVLAEVLGAGGKLLTIGNGGSAADAMHLAEELVGRYRDNRRPLPAIALMADGTLLTCIGNDFGFDQIFSRQVEALGTSGDALVIFTSSGNSPNLILALEQAKKQGLKTVAFLGKGGGKLKDKADVQWIVPSHNGARVQELHTWALHVVLEVVEKALFP